MSACPHSDIAAAFDPLDLRDPFPLLAEARMRQPVFYSQAIDYWVITRHATVKAILRDHQTYSAANTITPIVPFSDAVKQALAAGDYKPEPVLSNNVPPSHTRIRALVNRLFTPRRMKSFAPVIRQIARDAVAALDAPPVDIVAALTYSYPAQVLFAVLGVPAADVPQVKAWAGERIKLYYGRPSPADQLEMTADLVPFWRYVVALVADKARAPQDDLTSDLIRLRAGNDSVLTLNEIASCMITLLVAGHETTTAQLTNALLHLLNPPQSPHSHGGRANPDNPPQSPHSHGGRLDPASPDQPQAMSSPRSIAQKDLPRTERGAESESGRPVGSPLQVYHQTGDDFASPYGYGGTEGGLEPEGGCPPLWQALCDDPRLIPPALEEMMRYDPSVCAWRRLTTAPSRIDGVDIPAGANLLLMLHAANRDEGVFPEPEAVCFDRDNLKEQLAFGYGIHYCVGAPLARLEMRILLETLVEQLPSLRLLPGQEIQYSRNISFRGPTALRVSW